MTLEIEVDNPDFECYWSACESKFDCLEELAIHIESTHIVGFISRKK